MSTGQGVLGHNTFGYCGNEPISRSDSHGAFWHIIIGAAIGAATSAIAKIVTNVVTGENWNDGVGLALAVGALDGALASSGLGVVARVIGGAVIAGTESFISQAKTNGINGVDAGTVVFDSFIGGALSAIGGVSPGDGKHLMKHGITATKRVVSTYGKSGAKAACNEFLRAGKYYLTQTATIFYKPLLKNIDADILTSVTLDTSKHYIQKLINERITR